MGRKSSRAWTLRRIRLRSAPAYRTAAKGVAPFSVASTGTCRMRSGAPRPCLRSRAGTGPHPEARAGRQAATPRATPPMRGRRTGGWRRQLPLSSTSAAMTPARASRSPVDPRSRLASSAPRSALRAGRKRQSSRSSAAPTRSIDRQRRPANATPASPAPSRQAFGRGGLQRWAPSLVRSRVERRHGLRTAPIGDDWRAQRPFAVGHRRRLAATCRAPMPTRRIIGPGTASARSRPAQRCARRSRRRRDQHRHDAGKESAGESGSPTSRTAAPRSSAAARDQRRQPASAAPTRRLRLRSRRTAGQAADRLPDAYARSPARGKASGRAGR